METPGEVGKTNSHTSWPRIPRQKNRWRFSEHDMLLDFSPISLAEMMESNLLAAWIRLNRWLGFAVHDEDDLLWFFSGLPFHLANGIAAATLPPEKLEERLTQLTASGVPMVWLVSLTTRWRVDLEKSLLQHGWSIKEFSGLAIDLLSLEKHLSLPPQLTIVEVSDTETFRSWLHVLMLSSEALTESPGFLQDVVSSHRYKNDPAVHCYLGFLDGRPVATSLLYLDIGVAGIYCVSTLPEVRRRGIGSAITLAPLLEARTRGYRIGTLQATPMTLNFYQHLGFHEVCQFQAYFFGR